MHGYRTQYYIESVGQSKSLKKWTSFKSSFLKNCHLFYFYFETTEILLFAYRIRENTFRTEIWLRFILSLRTGTDNSLFLFFFKCCSYNRLTLTSLPRGCVELREKGGSRGWGLWRPWIQNWNQIHDRGVGTWGAGMMETGVKQPWQTLQQNTNLSYLIS